MLRKLGIAAGVIPALVSCSSQPAADEVVEKVQCSQALVDLVAKNVAGSVIIRLRQSSEDIKDVHCRTFARGLAGEFFYTSAMIDAAGAEGCDWSSADPQAAGINLLQQSQIEADEICDGKLQSLVAGEKLRAGGTSILNSMPSSERQAVEQEWQNLTDSRE